MHLATIVSIVECSGISEFHSHLSIGYAPGMVLRVRDGIQILGRWVGEEDLGDLGHHGGPSVVEDPLVAHEADSKAVGP